MSTRDRTSPMRSMAATEASHGMPGQASEPEKVARYQVRREAGWALGASTPMQKHLRPLLGVDKSTVSRMVSGEKSSVVSRYYEFVRDVVRDPRADIGHVLAGAMLVAEQEACKLPSEEVRRRLEDALAQESLLEGEENVAQLRLAAELRENGPGLRGALEGYNAASCHEVAKHLDGLIYARALLTIRGWRQPA